MKPVGITLLWMAFFLSVPLLGSQISRGWFPDCAWFLSEDTKASIHAEIGKQVAECFGPVLNDLGEHFKAEAEKVQAEFVRKAAREVGPVILTSTIGTAAIPAGPDCFLGVSALLAWQDVLEQGSPWEKPLYLLRGLCPADGPGKSSVRSHPDVKRD